jgi:leucine dehydrogenase
LKDETVHGKAVMDKGILYAPDFAINAGGLMNCYHEIIGYNHDAAMKQAAGIYDTITAIIKTSNEKGIPTYLAANHVAEERIRAKGGNI